MKYLKAALTKFKQAKDETFEFCFQSQDFIESAVPKLVFHFAFDLKSYVIDDAVKSLESPRIAASLFSFFLS